MGKENAARKNQATVLNMDESKENKQIIDKGWNMELFGKSDARVVNGARRSPFHIITAEEELELIKEIESIGAATINIYGDNLFCFNDTRAKGTGYIDDLDIIIVRGNVFPDLISGSVHPRDIMSSRAVLAHEYYGHRRHRGTRLPAGCWQDEFRASRIAAEYTPNLTDEEIMHLALDAIERKRESGVVVNMDKFMSRIIYGYQS